MLKYLKAATRTRHVALEQLLPLLDPNLSHATYRQYVRGLFGFYEPLEQQMLAFPGWDAVGFDYAPRHKTPRLRDDLRALGDTDSALAALPRCERLPPLLNEAQLWGCLYVIEGATLGGQIIIKNLNANLGLTASAGASFFDGYGAQTGSRWKAFCAAVPIAGDGAPGGASAMLHSANLTFDLLSEWLFPGSVGDRAPQHSEPADETPEASRDGADFSHVDLSRAGPAPCVPGHGPNVAGRMS